MEPQNPYTPPEADLSAPPRLLTGPLVLTDPVVAQGRHSIEVGRQGFRLHHSRRSLLLIFLAVPLLFIDVLRPIGLGLLVYCVVLLVLRFVVVEHMLRKTRRLGVGLFEWHRMEIGREGCNIATPNTFASLHWPQVLYFKEREGLFNLYTQPNYFNVLHRDFFASEADFQRAVQIVRENVKRK